MKGIVLNKAGGEYALVDTLDKPTPAKKQILVKSLATGLNPVEAIQFNGVLVDSFPIVLGCDASGIVVEAGEEVTKFKKGDAVFSCTRLGAPGYGTFQEYFLMDENLTFIKPNNISTEKAATIGVGLLTAALGLFSGTKISLEARSVDENAEWIVILGSAGAVGQYAVQLAKLAGYKVLAFCSPLNNELVKSLGADATVSHKTPVKEQLEGVDSITHGNFNRIFDASAMAAEFSMQALAEKAAKEKTKYFATTNDWDPINPKDGIEVYKIELGEIGKLGTAQADKLNGDIKGYIPKLETFLANGTLKPMAYELIENVGIGQVLKGLKAFSTRKSDGKKLVVKLCVE